MMNKLYAIGAAVLAFLGAIFLIRRDAVEDAKRVYQAERDKAEIQTREKADEIRDDVERTDTDERRKRLRDQYTRK